MFCESCEKYLSVSSLLCSFCNRKNSLKLDPKKSQSKEYAVQSVKERQKGTKIKEECPECKSEYLYYYTMQLRSADEGQTVFYECDCGYKAKLNT
ncbi:DNA-directed RNA polymerase I subunit RPA12 [Nematocida minor]|uniref:DNA-directed RNA polymerase I subunit RPA12 n=1 Tax=Nematocida minor TaxID=1912983 RepID=UPI00222019FF|nr:DNA-directed RNA polymerase I subunit RPA12 [Nematocida minor]XP_051331915.1 DNA-directed RNA polymerase I subunit RPA12 [Nematocida minor]KAI5188742.1 DNA-directed RNA polymerase I subunit RPA12 [Nematocida minor]KAI5188749.1 DNA-directed RNA polymerase I subunit RPA12 [Nematocida minor]